MSDETESYADGDKEDSPRKIPSAEVAYITACEMLKTTPSHSILKGLSTKRLLIKHRNIGPVGVKALAAALVQSRTVEILDLEENGLEGEGTVYICDMLAENTSITDVNLARNMMESVGATAISDLIQSNNRIIRLDLSDNKLRDCDAEILANAIERNEKIVHLNLSHNSFSYESAVHFSQAFGGNNSIEHLDLSWNQFSRKASALLFAGFKKNYCLTSVNLSWNGIDIEGCTALCDTLRGNKYLKELDIGNNHINWDGALQLSKGLKENDTLETLLVGGNPLSMTGVLDILDAVDNPQSAIVHISFKGVPVNRKIVYIIESIQKSRKMSVEHGCMIEGNDIVGKRLVLRCDPLKLLIQFLADKSIKPYDLFRLHDPEKQYKVPREFFIKGLKSAKVPLDDYDYEKLLLRFDSSGKEGKINYQRLIKGVKDQIKLNKNEEKQRKNDSKLVDRQNVAPDEPKELKVEKTKEEEDVSPRSTPSPSEDMFYDAPVAETQNKFHNIKSNFKKSNMASSEASSTSRSTDTRSSGSFTAKSVKTLPAKKRGSISTLME